MIGTKQPCLIALGAMLALGAATSSSRAAEVEWRTDYNAARKEMLEKGRPMILCVVSDAMCGPGPQRIKELFSDEAIAARIDAHFVLLRINASKEPKLADALWIHAYPTVILATQEGKIVAKIEGVVEKDRFLDLLDQIEGLCKTPAQ